MVAVLRSRISGERATFVAGDVEQFCLLAVGGRPEIGAAVHVGAGVAHHRAVALPVVVEGLHVLGRIVVDRLAGFRVDALGPGHLGRILHGVEELAVRAIERVVEAVAIGVDEELAILAVNPAVDDDLRARRIVVAVVVLGVLEVPLHLAGLGIEGDRRVGEQVVAGTIGGVVARRRIAGAPVREVARRIVGAGDVERAAAGAPRLGLVLPGLAAGLARRRNDEGLPLHVAGLRIERGEPVAHAIVAARGADQDGVFGDERGSGEFEIGLVADLLVPHDFARLLVGGDHAAVVAGDRDDQ